MAVGITSYGSYVPYRRLKRAAIAQVLGTPAGKGERAVASFAEDSVSMAVEAVRDAHRGAPAKDVRSLVVATTTPPYAEKLNAALVGAAAQLPLEIRAADLTGSPRVGLTAGYRFLHISNAGQDENNPGLNTNIICTGVSYTI